MHGYHFLINSFSTLPHDKPAAPWDRSELFERGGLLITPVLSIKDSTPDCERWLFREGTYRSDVAATGKVYRWYLGVEASAPGLVEWRKVGNACRVGIGARSQ